MLVRPPPCQRWSVRSGGSELIHTGSDNGMVDNFASILTKASVHFVAIQRVSLPRQSAADCLLQR